MLDIVNRLSDCCVVIPEAGACARRGAAGPWEPARETLAALAADPRAHSPQLLRNKNIILETGRESAIVRHRLAKGAGSYGCPVPARLRARGA